MKYKKITISDFLPGTNGMLDILKWCKKEGENFSKYNILLEVINDNEVLEIKSFWSGKVVKINIFKGQPISPTTVIAQVKIK